MFGFLIGTLCLIGLVKTVRHQHGYGGHGCGRGGQGGGHRRRWLLRRAFERLGTTPGQEKVILEAADVLAAQRETLRAEARASRADLVGALRAEAFDEARVRSAFERQQTVLAELQGKVVEQLGKVFEALEPDQRRMVADLLERGPRGFHGHHGGHHFGHHGPCGC